MLPRNGKWQRYGVSKKNPNDGESERVKGQMAKKWKWQIKAFVIKANQMWFGKAFADNLLTRVAPPLSFLLSAFPSSCSASFYFRSSTFASTPRQIELSDEREREKKRMLQIIPDYNAVLLCSPRVPCRISMKRTKHIHSHTYTYTRAWFWFFQSISASKHQKRGWTAGENKASKVFCQLLDSCDGWHSLDRNQNVMAHSHYFTVS